MKKMIVSVLVLVTVLSLTACFGGKQDDSKITMEEFEAVEDGMTYEQICEIIGGEGTLMSSNGRIAAYRWEGNGMAGSNAIISIWDGVVSSKVQVGLQ